MKLLGVFDHRRYRDQRHDEEENMAEQQGVGFVIGKGVAVEPKQPGQYSARQGRAGGTGTGSSRKTPRSEDKRGKKAGSFSRTRRRNNFFSRR